ncbi:MAG: toll/interleukin-1 receptor domain-containing protein [bacterium]|jgi:uncharacterized protein YjbI with pentapeptide repeats
MANDEHVSIALKGAEAIAVWRSGRPDAQLDLSGAALRRVELVRANLNGADLRGTNFEWADFRWADAIGADFSGSNLDRADFHKSDLRGATFRGTNISDTNFEDADLRNGDFEEAVFLHTRLLNSDMAGAKGLQTSIHRGPSLIDSETLMKAGYLPSVFLRGCGLSEAAIEAAYVSDTEALADSLESGGEYYSCFISYASQDSLFAKRLHADLQGKGARCWFDKRDLRTGAKILDSIYEAIRRHEKLLLIISENSIASTWVEDEVLRAISEERDRGDTVIFPIRIDDGVNRSRKSWAVKIRDNRHITDFNNWRDRNSYRVSLNRLLTDLKKEATS